MAQVLNNNSTKSVIAERLYQGYQTAMQMPGHKSMVQLPTGIPVYVMVGIKLNSKKNGQKIEKPYRSRKEEVVQTQKEISALAKKNAELLKKKGLTLQKILKGMPKIRAQLVKERYGL